MVQPVIDANFMARLQGYWTHVLAGSVGLGNDFFFPRTAYLQLKTIPNAGGDFDTRLYHDYRNDVIADHELVTSAGPGAKVLGVDVPAAAVHWVPPGVEVQLDRLLEGDVRPGALRGRRPGQKSFAIDSMISWRGQWYVVHLGPDWRPGAGGWVCKPDPPTPSPVSTECLQRLDAHCRVAARTSWLSSAGCRSAAIRTTLTAG